jgi:hypothetical protein
MFDAVVRMIMDDRALIRSFEGVHDKRFLAYAALALLAFAVVLGGVVLGFRANHVARSADAMALVHPPPARIMAAPPVK